MDLSEIPLEDIKRAAASLLGKTNRAIVFSRINGAKYLDPNAPRDEKQGTPSLSKLLPIINDCTADEFLTRVRDELTVSSFAEFVEVFQPGYYYKLQAGKSIAGSASTEMATGLPLISFSLDGGDGADGEDEASGNGWRRVAIGQDNAYIQRIVRLLDAHGFPDRLPGSSETDASLLIWRPERSISKLYDRAWDLQESYRALVQEAPANRASQSTLAAVKDYDAASDAFLDDVEEYISILPTIVFDAESSPPGGDDRVEEREFETKDSQSIARRIRDLVGVRQASGSLGNEMAGLVQEHRPDAPSKVAVAEIERDSAAFDEIYTNAISDYLKTTGPLFAEMAGIYVLFNEFAGSEETPPEVIFANDGLPNLLATRQSELERYFEISNHQAANQFQDAISFAILPQMASFRNHRPSARRTKFEPGIDPDLEGEVGAAQGNAAELADDRISTLVCDQGDLITLMDYGWKFGFQVLFCPEEQLLPGIAKRADYEAIRNDYSINPIVSREEADAAVLCLPDYEIVPAGGRLVVGRRTASGFEHSIEVPGLIVRACFVVAGRLMANDLPACLVNRLARRADSERYSVIRELPGVAVDLSRPEFQFLCTPNLPAGRFVDQGVQDTLNSEDMPFTVFLPGCSLSGWSGAARTMRQEQEIVDGKKHFRSVHRFRQVTFINRLIETALALAGMMDQPESYRNAEQEIQPEIYLFAERLRWCRPGYVINSLPDRLAS